MFDLLVKNGRVIGPDRADERSILISEGRIAALIEPGEEPAAREIIDATSKIVLPGLVDSHVHFREPGLTHKEDFASGSLSAAAGGVTTVMVMPTDDPFTMTSDTFAEKCSLAEGKCYVDFALQAGLGRDLRHVRALSDLGAISFEIFLSDLPAGLLVDNVADLVDCLEAVRDVGSIAGITPGENSLYARALADAKRRHGSERRAFPLSRPPAAEAIGVAQACLAAGLAQARIHLRQISCAASLAALAALRPQRTSAEVTPHNLILDQSALVVLGPVAKVSPPLRPAADVMAVRRALVEGAVDMVATDHAPHHPDEKAAGIDNIWKAPGGFPGVQTLLPLMLRLVADGAISYERLVQTCCEAPARTFGLHPRKGALQVGSDADLVIIDPKRPMTIRNSDQLSKACFTPFDGTEVPATPVLACLRGTIVMRDGRPVGPASGQFVRP